MDYVENLNIFTSTKFAHTSRHFKEQDTEIQIGTFTIGAKTPMVIAGPCAVESREQLFTTATHVKSEGAHMLRGGVFKPRSSPYAFQGMGIEGLELLKEISLKLDIPFVTEATSEDIFNTIEPYADVIQLGARNMYNYDLLKRAGKSKKPILLKRFFSATLQEFLSSAEYIISSGNPNVILCERGIRGFDHLMRNLLDISSVALLKHITHLPILADPSHGCGHPFLIQQLSMASLAAGAHGIMVEVHNDPKSALCDGYQSLGLEPFTTLIQTIQKQ
jgi:3-deoxy-7-phosphoheptulonate synthase